MESPEKRQLSLKGLKFVLDSKLDGPKDIENDVKKLGGSVASRVTEKVAALISTRGELPI